MIRAPSNAGRGRAKHGILDVSAEKVVEIMIHWCGCSSLYRRHSHMGSDYRQKGLKSEKGLKITERSQKHYKGLK